MGQKNFSFGCIFIFESEKHSIREFFAVIQGRRRYNQLAFWGLHPKYEAVPICILRETGVNILVHQQNLVSGVGTRFKKRIQRRL